MAKKSKNVLPEEAPKKSRTEEIISEYAEKIAFVKAHEKVFNFYSERIGTIVAVKENGKLLLGLVTQVELDAHRKTVIMYVAVVLSNADVKYMCCDYRDVTHINCHNAALFLDGDSLD